MHSRKNLVRIVTLALTLGLTGVMFSYADDDIIVENGKTVQLDNKEVHGAWAKKGGTIIANNVNFKDGEVTADGGTLEITGGTIDSGMDSFTADAESKVTTNGTVIKTGVWANNSHFELNDSTITGNYLYAGNAGSEGHDEYNGGKSGQIYIRGGTTNVEHVHAWNAGTVKLTGEAQLTATDVTVNGRNVTDATIEMKDDKGNTHEYRAQRNTNVISDKNNEKSYFRVVYGSTAEITDSVYLNQGTLAVDGDNANVSTRVTIHNNLNMKNGSELWMGRDAHLSVKNVMAENSFIRLYQENDTEKNPELDVTGTLTVKGKLSNDNPNGYMETGTLTANAVQIEKDARFEVAGGTFNAGMVTLDGTGATGDTELAYLGDSKGTLGQVRITKGADLWLGGNEGNPTVQVTDSLAVSDGGRVIVASGTLTTNQVQVGNQGTLRVGQNNVSTQSMARSAVVQNGNATFQAGNLSLDTGANVEVNNGSSLETNKLTMQPGSTVTVSGVNSVYTVKGEENTIASGALLKATDNGTVTFAADSATSATAGAVTDGKSKVSTIATASNGGQVKVEDGAKLFIQNSQRNVNYDLKDIITTEGSGSQTDGTFSVYGKNSLHAGILNEDGSYSIQGLDVSDLKNSLAAHVIAKADENGTGKLAEFINQAYGEATNGNIDLGNAAMNQALGISAMGGVMHGTYGFAENVSTLAAEHKADGAGLWASYLRHDEKVDGFKVGHEQAKYDVKYNGFAMGGDFAVTDTSRTGVAFAYADGNINAKNGTYTKTDTKYYGADVYHHFTAGGVQYTADVGYIKSDNDLKQVNLGETITASVDGNTFFMGIRAEKPMTLKNEASGISTLTPYVGLRYYRVHLGDFTDTLGVRHETENADIWNLPIGVEFRNETKNGNWAVTPLVEVGYRFAMGDKETKEKVHFDGASDTFSYDVGENAFLTRVGVEAKNDSLSLAGGYRYQKGSDTQSNQWYVQVGYRF